MGRVNGEPDDSLTRFANWLPRSSPRREPRAKQVTLDNQPEVASPDERCGSKAYFRPLGTGVTMAGAWDMSAKCVLARGHDGQHLSLPRREHRLPWRKKRWYAYSWPGGNE